MTADECLTSITLSGRRPRRSQAVPVRLLDGFAGHLQCDGYSGYNAAERAIRPFVIGRNNWLFSDTPRGAEASARLYSLISTAKANGHEPYRYLRHVFKELPAAESVADFEALLPYNLTPESLD